MPRSLDTNWANFCDLWCEIQNDICSTLELRKKLGSKVWNANLTLRSFQIWGIITVMHRWIHDRLIVPCWHLVIILMSSSALSMLIVWHWIHIDLIVILRPAVFWDSVFWTAMMKRTILKYCLNAWRLIMYRCLISRASHWRCCYWWAHRLWITECLLWLCCILIQRLILNIMLTLNGILWFFRSWIWGHWPRWHGRHFWCSWHRMYWSSLWRQLSDIPSVTRGCMSRLWTCFC